MCKLVSTSSPAGREEPTARRLAAASSNKAAVARLLTLGADKTARDQYNRLPADWMPQPDQELRDLLRL